MQAAGAVIAVGGGTGESQQCFSLFSVLDSLGAAAARLTCDFSPNWAWLREAVLHLGAVPDWDLPVCPWLCFLWSEWGSSGGGGIDRYMGTRGTYRDKVPWPPVVGLGTNVKWCSG